MSFENITSTEVFALTRMRRAEARERRTETFLAKYGPTRRYPGDLPRVRFKAPGAPVDVFTMEVLRETIRRPALKRRRQRKLDIEHHVSDLEERRIIREHRTRERLVKVQNNRCYLCSFPFTDKEPPTLDHVWPRSRGGTRMRNVLVAHPRCNGIKADRKPTPLEMAMLREINFKLDEKAAPLVEP